MASFTTFFSLLLYTITVFLLDQGAGENRSACPKRFSCGSLGTMKYPFSSNLSGPECGLLKLECAADPLPRIQIGRKYYYAYGKLGDYIRLYDPELEHIVLNRPRCNSFDTNISLSLPSSPWVSFVIPHNFTVFRCPKSHPNLTQQMNRYGYSNHTMCGGFSLFYRAPGEGDPLPNLRNHGFPPKCSPILLPYEKEYNTDDLFDIISVAFVLEWLLSEDCSDCQKRGGQCVTTANNQFHCSRERGNSYWRTVVMAALGGIAVLLSLSLIFILWRRKRDEESPYIFSRNASRDPCLSHDLEMGSQSFGVPVFSFKELKDATKNFDSSTEIGDGGFGTVYHGKLSDGREVAVKRLHQHNVKRMEQFLNEIKILTGLRHDNLVTLHGCTSRCSRELILVYEYIPNGTVAEHLHGERAKEGSLTWPIRMNIAVETANALAYLHASDIIHRDVKTNNMLLDNNFRVKVADFGLSRLFPTDVTHISTAPQGTPGYVDPEYHECYQLTDKSDVYSFGVVLVELITSKPAVDISRDKHEINLASIAMSRILRRAYDELIDPSLGFSTDAGVKRMAISVADLAFQCLQLQKDMRPTMDEVLENLKEIQHDAFNTDEEDEDEEEEEEEEEEESENDSKVSTSVRAPLSPETENMILLRANKQPNSTDSMSDRWTSNSSTASNNR